MKFDRDPAYSFAGKSVQKDFHDVPGPGSYYRHIRTQSAGGPVFGTSKRDARYRDDGPGPGGYNVEGKVDAPYIGFGTSERETGTSTMKDVPGPGAYKAKSARGRSVSITPRRIDLSAKMGKDTPGPGAYSASGGIFKSPSIGFGTSKRDRGAGNAKDTPGPGNYNISARPASASTFGKSHRGTGGGCRDSPGPGAYSISGATDGPQFSMASRYSNRKGDAVPGPGSYGRVGSRRGSGAGIRFGKEKRSQSYKTENPGPGSYKSQSTLSGPKFGFGSQEKGERRKRDDYGPMYNIPAAVPNMAPYEIPGDVRSRYSVDY
jgi:hypothetical protein